MRSSELMELEVGCCHPPEEHGPGLVRYRLASKVIKGQPLGGTPDEWVVIEPAYQAAQLLERLHDNPQPGKPLLGRFAFDVRHAWFRNWVNGPAGQRRSWTSPTGAGTLRHRSSASTGCCTSASARRSAGSRHGGATSRR
jgi:hypothetical protein